MRSETLLTDLLPEFRVPLQDALTENGWDQDRVQLIVARAYDFLGPFVSARIQRGSVSLGDENSECLVVEFHPPAGRDLEAAEETYQQGCELANSGDLPGALALLRAIVH